MDKIIMKPMDKIITFKVSDDEYKMWEELREKIKRSEEMRRLLAKLYKKYV